MTPIMEEKAEESKSSFSSLTTTTDNTTPNTTLINSAHNGKVMKDLSLTSLSRQFCYGIRNGKPADVIEAGNWLFTKTGCDALLWIGDPAFKRENFTRLSLSTMGVARAAVDGLKMFAGRNVIALETCLKLLRNLCWCEANQPKMMHHIQDVIHAMNLHIENEEIQKFGCSLIAACAISEKTRILLIFAGVALPCLRALKVHSNNASVSVWALIAFWWLANDDVGNRAVLRKLEVIENIVKVLKIHPDDVDIQREGISTLHWFSKELHRNLKLMECGSVEIIVTAMKNHPDNHTIQISGCKTLLNFIESDTECTQLLLKTNRSATKKVVVTAMKKYPFERELQTAAKKLVRML